MVDQEWLENYKEHVLELWHSEYPDEGEPYANLDEVIIDQLRNADKSVFGNQLTNFKVEEADMDQLDEMVMNVLARDHFATKPY
ncbi:MAG: hypothetical protein SCK28_03290 [Bacillota bacterium]|nr:hypothetical protein [Bacillota bacterium]